MASDITSLIFHAVLLTFPKLPFPKTFKKLKSETLTLTLEQGILGIAPLLDLNESDKIKINQ